MPKHLLKLLIVALAASPSMVAPARACSPQELADKVEALTNLMIEPETGRKDEHADRTERMHAAMAAVTRQSDISYDGLCASYDQLIASLRRPARPAERQ